MKSFSAYEQAARLTINMHGFCCEAHTLLSGAASLRLLIVLMRRFFLALAHISTLTHPLL
jgi:hypothetical protein